MSGSTLTVTGAGTIVVAANQTGNANYSAAAQVTASIVVNQATQTITGFAPATPVTLDRRLPAINVVVNIPVRALKKS